MDNLPNITKFDQPIPGQSLTVAPGSLPYERPPEMVNIEDALDHVFRGIINDKSIYSLLGLMEAGLPISTITQVILTTGFAEGKWSGPMIYQMAPAVGIMLMRIADAAKISYKVTAQDGKPKPASEILVNLAKVRINEVAVRKGKQAAEMSARDTKKMKGFLAPG